MIQIFQTILEPPYGDCFRACLASILERPLAFVPNFHEDNDDVWVEVQLYNEWLQPANLELFAIQYDKQDPRLSGRGYSILTCTPPAKEPNGWNHCVVMLEDLPIFNPMPGFGRYLGDLGEWRYYERLAIRDPSKPVSFLECKPPWHYPQHRRAVGETR